jgi:hypothetical protein
VLTGAVEGAADYLRAQETGADTLRIPKAVTILVKEFREAASVFGRFDADCLRKTPGAGGKAGNIGDGSSSGSIMTAPPAWHKEEAIREALGTFLGTR